MRTNKYVVPVSEQMLNLRTTSYMQLVIKKAGSPIAIRNFSPKTWDAPDVFQRVCNMLNLMGIQHTTGHKMGCNTITVTKES